MDGNYVFGADKLTVKYAPVSASTSGNNTIVAAVAGKELRVLGFMLVAAGAVTVQWQSGAGGTALSGVMSLAANGAIDSGISEVGIFETAVGALLNLSLGGAVSVGGYVIYVEV